MRARRTLMESREGFQRGRSGLSTALVAFGALGIAGCVGVLAWVVAEDHYRAVKIARLIKEPVKTIQAAAPPQTVTIEGPIAPRSSKYEVDSSVTKWIVPMMERKLKDPASARLRNVLFVRKNAMRFHFCGELNSKNSFGAYTGWEPFVLSIVLDGEGGLDQWGLETAGSYRGREHRFREYLEEDCEL